MSFKGLVPLAFAAVGIIAQTSLLVTRQAPGRGELWISIVTSLWLGLFLLTFLMAAQFAGSGMIVRSLVVLVLLGLAFNVFVNFMGLTERDGLALDSTYQLVATICLAVVLVLGGLTFVTSYGRQFNDAAAVMVSLGESPWEESTPDADQLAVTLGKMRALARMRNVQLIPQAATPAELRRLGTAMRPAVGQTYRPSVREAYRFRQQMPAIQRQARVARPVPAAVVAPPGPDPGMAAAAGGAGAPAGPI
jgi:hypothetical protein